MIRANVSLLAGGYPQTSPWPAWPIGGFEATGEKKKKATIGCEVFSARFSWPTPQTYADDIKLDHLDHFIPGSKVVMLALTSKGAEIGEVGSGSDLRALLSSFPRSCQPFPSPSETLYDYDITLWSAAAPNPVF